MRKKRTNRAVRQLVRDIGRCSECRGENTHKMDCSQRPAPSNFLDYKGDIGEDVIGQVVGPDRFGARYQAVTSVYELATNSTRVGFVPVYRRGVGGRTRV